MSITDQKKKILLILIVAIFVQLIPEAYQRIIVVPLKPHVTTSAILSFDLSGVPAGDYYLSVGKPRTPCDITLGSAVIASNLAGTLNTRSSILLGASLTLPSSSNYLSVNCYNTPGFPPRFTHAPTLAQAKSGVLLHLFRFLVDVVLGPFASIILIIASIITPKKKYDTQSFSKGEFLTFGIVSLTYTLSLSYVPMMFLSGYSIVLLHILTRTAFSASFLWLLNFKLNRSLILAAHILIALVALVIFGIRETWLVQYYSLIHGFFGLMTLVIALNVLIRKCTSSSLIYLAEFALVTVVLQFFDTIRLAEAFGLYLIPFRSYFAPAIPAILAVFSAWLLYRESRFSIIADKMQEKLLLTIESRTKANEILKGMLTTFSDHNPFTNTTAYADTFCLGLEASPMTRFVLLAASMETWRTEEYRNIDLRSGHGSRMLEALKTGAPLIDKGLKDGCWFIIAPIGKYGCINMRGDKSISVVSAYEILEITKRLNSTLRMCGDRLMMEVTRMITGLHRVRSNRGIGRWQEPMAVIFGDICNYSAMYKKYGQCFLDFVAKDFLLSLTRFVQPYSVQEETRGDEILLISIPELLPDKSDVMSAAAESITKIRSFISNEGAQICTDNGFEPLRMSFGVNVGEGTIISDETGVRTTGKLIIEAKRLLEAAPSGTFLVRDSVADGLSKRGFIFGENFPILVKKDLFMARQLLKTG